MTFMRTGFVVFAPVVRRDSRNSRGLGNMLDDDRRNLGKGNKITNPLRYFKQDQETQVGHIASRILCRPYQFSGRWRIDFM